MATTLTDGSFVLQASVQGRSEKSADLSVPKDIINLAKVISLAFGTGVGKANQVWHDRRVLAGGADEGTDIDLAGILKNAFNDTITFAKVRAILIINQSHLDTVLGVHTEATTAKISIGGAATEVAFLGPFQNFSDVIELEAGNVFLITNNTADGWTVTADSVDILLITNEESADSAEVVAMYDIIIIGEEVA